MTSRVTRAFVDRIEESVAVLRIDGAGTTVELPAALLPEGAGEGAWVEIAIHPVEAPDGAAAGEALRRTLSRDDDGGDFSL
jgi:DUF3006 family protein